ARKDQCRGPDALVAEWRRVRHRADQVEVPDVAVCLDERRVGLQEQGVTGPQQDVADALPQPSAVPGHGYDHGAVEAAEPALLDGAADHGTAVRDHSLDEDAVGSRSAQLEDLAVRWGKAGCLLQVDD